MLRAKALDHVGLIVTDLDRTVHFYSLLGAEVLRRRHRGGGETSAVLRIGMQEINVFCPAGVALDPGGGPRAIDHFCLEMDCATIEDLIAGLREAGVGIAQGPVQRSDGVALFVHDPDGVRVELAVKR